MLLSIQVPVMHLRLPVDERTQKNVTVTFIKQQADKISIKHFCNNKEHLSDAIRVTLKARLLKGLKRLN